MAIYAAKNGQLQTIKGIYYGVSEDDYINETLFHNLVPNSATEIRFLYASNNPDLTDYQRIGYCDNNNFIEVWNSGTKYIIINPRKNYIYAPENCYNFLSNYTALTSCIFDNFDTRYVTSMSRMFYYCSSLTSLDLTSFNTANVTSMSYMFYCCRSLTSLDLTSFDTANVTSMGAMFYYCSSLTSLDLTSFDTANVTSMGTTFYFCSSLTSLDLTSFDTANVTSMWAMFQSCSRLITIISNSFVLKEGLQSSNMFSSCTALVGGNGTTYNSSHINADYARVDGEDGLPGYFTAPN